MARRTTSPQVDAPILQVVQQRGKRDCAIACLAMICGASYEQALVAVAQVRVDVFEKGMFTTEMIRAAKYLNVTLRLKKPYDLDTDTGILSLASKKWPLDHVVVLKNGLIVDTDGTIWDADAFVGAHHAKPGQLLVVV